MISYIPGQKRKKRLRLLITTSRDPRQVTDLKHRRNTLSHRIRLRAKELASNELDARAREVEAKKDTAQMFHAVHLLQRQKQQPITVHDEAGRQVIQPVSVAIQITDHFSKLYTPEPGALLLRRPGLADQDCAIQYRRLERPISEAEVTQAAGKLNNGRSSGPDNMPGELLKYSPALVYSNIAQVLNSAVETGLPLNSIGSGSLIPLQKPGKSRGPVAHLRPVVLLTALRKILSLIVLRRINKDVNNFVAHTQSGFRPSRSTTDVVWSYRWLAARCQRYRCALDILGIDMSKAFDCISRPRLISVLGSFLQPDEIRMISYLLQDTVLRVVLPSAKGPSFPTLRGTPQGDSLSPVLFIVYLEGALRDVRPLLLPRPPADISLGLPTETAYADDVDFVTTDGERLRTLLPTISNKLLEWDLKVNETKTEHTHIERHTDRIEEEWRTTKKLGSLLGDAEDMLRRQQLATVAFGKLWTLWIRISASGSI
eukprot:scpid72716/ scgid1736/ LINE-1 reverse transcriptase homolog